MSTYIITYFAGRGKGELLRIICEEAGLSYKNNFVNNETWPALKPSTPFGQVPLLQIEEKPEFTLAQSAAIARYLAKQAGLVPADSEQAAYADSLVDFVGDIISGVTKIIFTAENKTEAFKKFKADTLPFYLEKLEAILKKNGTNHFVGDKLTWADLAIFDLLENLKVFKVDLTSYPAITAFFDGISARPNIAKYVASENRPKPYIPQGMEL